MFKLKLSKLLHETSTLSRMKCEQSEFKKSNVFGLNFGPNTFSYLFGLNFGPNTFNFLDIFAYISFQRRTSFPPWVTQKNQF